MTPRDQSVPPSTAGARRADDHERAQEVLSAAADGEQLDELALRAAVRHAESCPECAAFRTALARLARRRAPRRARPCSLPHPPPCASRCGASRR